MKEIYLFDWGDTLMVDTPGMAGKMCDWEYVEATRFAGEALKEISLRASIYVATAAAESTPEDIEKAFKRVGLNKYIKGYFCKQNTGFTKPAPEFYLAIIKQLSVNPSSVTMVGDNLEKDILPCHGLGFNTVWVTSEANKEVPEGVLTIADLGELASQ
ncbi:MAG: HAD family hydrolase [Desulfobacteraceae bacterium]|nr:HAD family hydrolase [Desulfobacteraceae bacterium]